jgi:tripartite-type tricarboxylate transporter receptor subunit TctC
MCRAGLIHPRTDADASNEVPMTPHGSLQLAATIVAAMWLAGSTPLAWAQSDLPDRPIRIIVPYNAGGAGDVMARAIGQSIGKTLGRSFVVENRPGGSGMIGTTAVARAKGDPTTLLLGSSGELSINPYLYRNVSYRPDVDFQPVAFAGKLPLVLVTHPKQPYQTVAELLELAAKKPGEIAFSSAGAGQVAHLAMEVIMQQKGVKLLHVPYKGGSEAVTAVITNNAQLFFSGMPPALSQIAAGNLRAMAVSTKERVKQLPNAPTMVESGLADFDIYNWFAVFAPADVPAGILEKLNKAIEAAIDSTELKSVWDAQGIVAQPMSPDALARFVVSESTKYRSLIEAAKIKIE